MPKIACCTTISFYFVLLLAFPPLAFSNDTNSQNAKEYLTYCETRDIYKAENPRQANKPIHSCKGECLSAINNDKYFASCKKTYKRVLNLDIPGKVVEEEEKVTSTPIKKQKVEVDSFENVAVTIGYAGKSSQQSYGRGIMRFLLKEVNNKEIQEKCKHLTVKMSDYAGVKNFMDTYNNKFGKAVIPVIEVRKLHGDRYPCIAKGEFSVIQ